MVTRDIPADVVAEVGASHRVIAAAAGVPLGSIERVTARPA